MHHIVYLTSNIINNKIYVGVHSTWNIDDGYLGSGLKLNNSIKKYGKENFIKKILYYCLESKDAYEIEKQIVDEIFLKRKDTYNIKLGGLGGFKHINNFGRYISYETRIKISIKAKERIKQKKEEGTFILSEKFTNKNRKHSEETKKKISENQKGKIISEEHKEKISIKAKERLSKPENNPMYGKKHSEETKEKFRNRKHSEETKRKIGEKSKNRKQSSDTISKRIEKTKGKKRSEKSKNNYKIAKLKQSNNIKYCIIYTLISPYKDTFILHGRQELNKIIEKYNLSYESLYSHKDKGIIKPLNKKGLSEKVKNTFLWEIKTKKPNHLETTVAIEDNF